VTPERNEYESNETVSVLPNESSLLNCIVGSERVVESDNVASSQNESSGMIVSTKSNELTRTNL
jgi:hypothetical protein